MTSRHAVKGCDIDLHILTDLGRSMTDIAAEQVRDAIAALLQRDTEAAKAAIAKDIAVDTLQREIERRAVITIACRQPAAIDLRHVIGILRIANDLERVGDLAKTIATRANALNGARIPSQAASGLGRMAVLLLDQLTLAMDAFILRDSRKATQAWVGDDAIDALFRSMVRVLLDRMGEEAADINLGIHLLFCAKNLEKIGDHVTHIAETSFYVAEGRALADILPSPSTVPAAGSETASAASARRPRAHDRGQAARTGHAAATDRQAMRGDASLAQKPVSE